MTDSPSLDLLAAGASLQGRTVEASVSALFPGRWSRRGISDRPVDEAMLASLFEAARWAPSSFNEQPWRFVVATTDEELARFRPWVMDGNRAWSDRAPVLCFVLARRTSARDGSPNAAAAFDTGAAWMSLALQAHVLGLTTHAMGGIHRDAIHVGLGADPELWQVICGLVIGWPDPEAPLTGWAAEAEAPNGRRPLAQIVHRGGLSEG